MSSTSPAPTPTLAMANLTKQDIDAFFDGLTARIFTNNDLAQRLRGPQGTPGPAGQPAEATTQPIDTR